MIADRGTDRVLAELRESPAWRDAERRATERETTERAQRIAELDALNKARAEEWPRLAEAVVTATRRVESAQAALEAAEAEQESQRHAESCAATLHEVHEGRLRADLVRSAAPLVERAERAIDAASESARACLWQASAGPEIATGYFVLRTSNLGAIEGALKGLLDLRHRPRQLAAEIADLTALDVEVRAVERQAAEIVGGISRAPEPGWIDGILGRIFGRAS